MLRGYLNELVDWGRHRASRTRSLGPLPQTQHRKKRTRRRALWADQTHAFRFSIKTAKENGQGVCMRVRKKDKTVQVYYAQELNAVLQSITSY